MKRTQESSPKLVNLTFETLYNYTQVWNTLGRLKTVTDIYSIPFLNENNTLNLYRLLYFIYFFHIPCIILLVRLLFQMFQRPRNAIS